MNHQFDFEESWWNLTTAEFTTRLPFVPRSNVERYKVYAALVGKPVSNAEGVIVGYVKDVVFVGEYTIDITVSGTSRLKRIDTVSQDIDFSFLEVLGHV
jgi:hypothetical protein